jgi:tetratricopeptide (TPR) repeat protein
MQRIILLLMLAGILPALAAAGLAEDADLREARKLAECGDYPAAIARYRSILSASPRCFEALNQLIKTHKTIGDLGSIDAELRSRVDADPADVAAHYGLGSCAFERGDMHAAIGHYDRALELEPDLAFAWRSKGSAGLYVYDYELASSCLRRALELAPDDPDFHLALAYFHINLSRHDHALDCALRAIAAEPDNDLAYMMTGYVYFSQARFDSSVRYYSEATRLAPDLVTPLVGLATYYRSRGDHDAALEA